MAEAGVEVARVDRAILEGIREAIEESNLESFLAELEKNMKSRNPKTRRRARAAYQHVMEFVECIRNFDEYLSSEPDSQVVQTVLQMLKHFSYQRSRSFVVVFGMKTYFPHGLRIGYHAHIVRQGGKFRVIFDVGWTEGRENIRTGIIGG